MQQKLHLLQPIELMMEIFRCQLKMLGIHSGSKLLGNVYNKNYSHAPISLDHWFGALCWRLPYFSLYSQ